MTSDELNSYYRKLNGNEEDKKFFVQNEVDSQSEKDEDSQDESQDQKVEVKVLQPRKRQKQGLDSELLAKLLAAQQDYLTLTKKMFAIKAERDKEELTHRYTQLDLNNKMVDAENYKKMYEDSRAFWKKTDLVLILFFIVFLRFFFRC